MRPTLSPAVCLLLCAIFVSFSEGARLCGEGLNKVLHDVCSFKGQDTPCFKGAFFDIQSLGRIRPISTVEGVATECCTYGCHYSYIKNYCCHTLECLQHCYPNARFTQIELMPEF